MLPGSPTRCGTSRARRPARTGSATASSRATPGACKGKAHRREYLGYAGRRVLVSRKWSGKTLADHRADRRTWLTSALGLPATDPARYTWEPVKPGDPDLPEIDLHDVRHSYATAGRDAKIDWKALSHPIGHSDVAFTMKQYVQTDLEADRQVANTLAELIIGGSLTSFEITGKAREAG